MKLLAQVFFVVALTSSCKPQTFLSLQGYILGGKNDIAPLQTTNSSNIPQKVLDASVLIATQVQKGQMKFCSGTLVEPAPGETNLRVLTNHHCFANVDKKGQIDANWIPVACLESRVYFGFNLESGEADISVIGCQENSLRSDVDGDVAVFTLKENPPEKYQPSIISSEKDIGEVNALILHYPDVASNYKKLSGENIQLPAASITNSDCVTKGSFPKSEWKLDRSLPYSLRHTCDLVQGSSGSALLHAETYEVIGVNWGGIKINYAEGSQLHNVATRADFVRAFLEGDVDQIKKDVNNFLSTSDPQSADSEVERYRDKNASLGSKVKDVACGQISDLSPASSWSYFLFLVLLVPGIVLFSKRRNDLHHK